MEELYRLVSFVSHRVSWHRVSFNSSLLEDLIALQKLREDSIALQPLREDSIALHPVTEDLIALQQPAW